VPPCSYTIDPASRSFKEKGGDGEVEVKTSTHCEWTADSTAGWIELRGPDRRVGAGRVSYKVSKNNSQWDRSGAIVIAGEKHTVTQEGRRGRNDDDDAGRDGGEDDD
jgi:hypothetical protein